MGQSRENYNAYMSDYMLKRYHTKMTDAKEQFGNVCSLCGSSEQLEFHHVNQADKSFTIGSKMLSLSDAKIQAELEKCQLICSLCHRQQHASSAPCGTAQRYWRGCRCKPCVLAYNEYQKEYKRTWRIKRV